jgi:hypothetical protein
MIERSSHSESTRSGLAPVAAALIAGLRWPGHARREATAAGAVPSATIIVAVCGAEVDGDAAPEPRLWLPPQRACTHGLGNEAAPSSLPSLHLAWAMPSPHTISWDPDDQPLWPCPATGDYQRFWAEADARIGVFRRLFRRRRASEAWPAQACAVESSCGHAAKNGHHERCEDPRHAADDVVASCPLAAEAWPPDAATPMNAAGRRRPPRAHR